MEKDDLSELHICPKCNAFFVTKSFLLNHMKRNCTRPTTKDEFSCQQCSQKFNTKYQLERHSLLHNGSSSYVDERPFKCEYCDKSFVMKAHLKRHNVIHLPEDQQLHKCDECNKAFAWPSELKSHQKAHAGEKRFKCGICGRMFSHLPSLKAHINNRHTYDGKLICVVCKSCFDEATELIIHMKTHSEEQSLKCDRCYALFTSLKDLETHICTNFGGNPLVCVSCIGEFETTQEYCKHECMQISFNRKCGCCSKMFKNLWHLREHLITHTGEKPYTCAHCDSKFRRKRELDIHSTRHSDKKPFLCQHCEQTFSSDAYLKQHQRKEHRAKKFVCHICKHAFMHRSALNNHVRFHEQTGNKEYGKKYHRKQVYGDTSAIDAGRGDKILVDTIPAVVPNIAPTNSEQSPNNMTTIFEKNTDGKVISRCASCLMGFESHSALLRHRKESHSDGKPYQCPQCFKTFSVAANLSQHQNTHKAPPRKYICARCGKGYNVTHKLRDHLKTKHGEDTQNITDLELESGTVTVPENLPLPKDIYTKSYNTEPNPLRFQGKSQDSIIQNFSEKDTPVGFSDSLNNQSKQDALNTLFVDL